MPSSRMLCRAALVRTDVSEEHIASIIRVTRIGELGTLAATSNRSSMLVTANVVPSLEDLNYKYDHYTRNLVDTSLGGCLHNRLLLSSCAMRFTTRSFEYALRPALY
jgi:hypothetical protein